MFSIRQVRAEQAEEEQRDAGLFRCPKLGLQESPHTTQNNQVPPGRASPNPHTAPETGSGRGNRRDDARPDDAVGLGGVQVLETPPTWGGDPA